MEVLIETILLTILIIMIYNKIPIEKQRTLSLVAAMLMANQNR